MHVDIKVLAMYSLVAIERLLLFIALQGLYQTTRVVKLLNTTWMHDHSKRWSDLVILVVWP